MSKLSLQAITGAKYVYLVVFFMLVAGFFHPIISGSDFSPVVAGTIILFVGLAGGILVYRASTVHENRTTNLVIGFVLITASLIAALLMIGRPILPVEWFPQ